MITFGEAATSLTRCSRSISPYSIEAMALPPLVRTHDSMRLLNPSQDSRPVSESRSCVALRASRRAVARGAAR